MIYDFGGFPEELYRIVYPAPGEPDVALKVAHLLQDAGLAPALVEGRGFDHGTWVPLRMIYPDADIPLVQLAVQAEEWAGRSSEAQAELENQTGAGMDAEERAEMLAAQVEEQAAVLPDFEDALRASQRSADDQRAETAMEDRKRQGYF